MAKSKQYRVVAEVGVVGFNGVIHAPGDTITSDTVPAANLKAWLRFKQIAEIREENAESGNADTLKSEEPKKGKK